LNQNQPQNRRKALCNRIRKASQEAGRIKKDLERDCIPYWKLDALAEELVDIMKEVKRVE